MKLGKVVVFLAMWGVMFLGTGIKKAWAVDEFCESTGHGAGSASPQVNTALGCVPVKVDEFVEWFLPYLFGIAGGISFLLMVSGFIEMASSGGDPKKVEGAKEKVTAAIMGLIVSIFALFLLKLIAIDILNIPGMK